MATYALVHGAWRGSFGFRHIRRALQQAGHDATAPSLTGLGERAHLASPQITLGTHVHDVVNHILYEDLHDIVLVGYSYGGAVVTACLDHVHDRVRDLVYLDAFVPADGQSLADLLGLPKLPITLGRTTSSQRCRARSMTLPRRRSSRTEPCRTRCSPHTNRSRSTNPLRTFRSVERT
jgi:pimeloyl-ACP methyl ester carboxylesterase